MPAEIPPTKRSETGEKPGRQPVVQFSIFLRNKVGALLDIVRVLGEHHVSVLATSIESSADTAIVRIIVSDPESVEGVFHLNNIAYSSCHLVVAELKEAAQFGELLSALLAAEVNIFGSYVLLNRPNDNPVLALHVEDNDCAESVLRSSGFRLLDQDDISR
jgi:hypothetical protein